jgi:uncharacterized protein (TIGR02646 family)
MIPFKRGENPLSSEEEITLGKWWETKYNERRKSSDWSWKGKSKIIGNALLDCHKDHCAYCDCHPLKDDRGFEIDHFKPKIPFFSEAFTYANLFPSCKECNKKMSSYDMLLVKPDEFGYKFEDFFRYDSFTGEILPNPSRSEKNQLRASKTIEIFKLNIGNKPRNRITAIRKEIDANTSMNERPYRYGY